MPTEATDPDLDDAADALKKILAVLSKLEKSTRDRVISTVVTFYPPAEK